MNCKDCGARPGELHASGCDVERCPACGGQAISCTCSDAKFAEHPRLPWTGRWPFYDDCERLGLWCYWGDRATGEQLEPAVFSGKPGSWFPCDSEHPGARPDMNRLYELGVWDARARQWVLRQSNRTVPPSFFPPLSPRARTPT